MKIEDFQIAALKVGINITNNKSVSIIGKFNFDGDESKSKWQEMPPNLIWKRLTGLSIIIM